MKMRPLASIFLIVCITLSASAQAPSAMPSASNPWPHVMLNGPHVDQLRALDPELSNYFGAEAVPQPGSLPSLNLTVVNPGALTRAEALTQIINRHPEAGAIRFALSAGLARSRHPDDAYRRSPVQAVSVTMADALQTYRSMQQNLLLGNLPQASREREIAVAALHFARGLNTPLGLVLRAEESMISSPMLSATGSPLDQIISDDRDFARTAALTVSHNLFRTQNNPFLTYQYLLAGDRKPELLAGFDLTFAQLIGAHTRDPLASLQARFSFLDEDPLLRQLADAVRGAIRASNGQYRLLVNMDRYMHDMGTELHEQRQTINHLIENLSSHPRDENIPETQQVLQEIGVKVELMRDGLGLVQAVAQATHSRPLLIATQAAGTFIQIQEQLAAHAHALSLLPGLNRYSDSAVAAARISMTASRLMNIATLCINLFSLISGGADNSNVLAAIESMHNDLRDLRSDFRDFEHATNVNFTQLGYGVQRISEQLSNLLTTVEQIGQNVGQLQTGMQSLQNQIDGMRTYFAGQETQRLRLSENTVFDSCGFSSLNINVSDCIASIKRHYNDNLQNPVLVSSLPRFPMNHSLDLMPLYSVLNSMFQNDSFRRNTINPLLWVQGASQSIRLFEVMQNLPGNHPLHPQFRQALPELCRLNQDFLSFAEEPNSFLNSMRMPFQVGGNENQSLQNVFEDLVSQYNQAAQQVRDALISVKDLALRGEASTRVAHGQFVDPYTADSSVSNDVVQAVRSSFSSASSCHSILPGQFPENVDLGTRPVPAWLLETLTNQDVYAQIAAQRAGQGGIQFCYEIELREGTTDEACTVRGVYRTLPLAPGGIPSSPFNNGIPVNWNTGYFKVESRVLSIRWNTLFNQRPIRRTVSQISKFPVRYFFTIEHGRPQYERCPHPRWPNDIFNENDITRRSWNNFHDMCAASNVLYGSASCDEARYVTLSQDGNYPTEYRLRVEQHRSMQEFLLAQAPSHYSRYESHGLSTQGSVTDEVALNANVTSHLDEWRQLPLDSFVQMIAAAFSTSAATNNERVTNLRNALRKLDQRSLAIEGFFRIFLPTSTSGSGVASSILSYPQTAGDETRSFTMQAFNPAMPAAVALSRINETQLLVSAQGRGARSRINIAQGAAAPRFSDQSTDYEYYRLCLPGQLAQAASPVPNNLRPTHLPRSTDVFCDVMSYFMVQPSIVASQRPQPQDFNEIIRSVDGLLSSLTPEGGMLAPLNALIATNGAPPGAPAGYRGHTSRFEYEQQNFRTAIDALSRNHNYCVQNGTAPLPYAYSPGSWGEAPFKL